LAERGPHSRNLFEPVCVSLESVVQTSSQVQTGPRVAAGTTRTRCPGLASAIRTHLHHHSHPIPALSPTRPDGCAGRGAGRDRQMADIVLAVWHVEAEARRVPLVVPARIRRRGHPLHESAALRTSAGKIGELASGRPYPVSELPPCVRGEPEHRSLTVLGVADQHAVSLRLHAYFDAFAAVTAAVTGLPPRRVHVHQLLSGSGPARLRAGAPRI
jgi:hypothetical protein